MQIRAMTPRDLDLLRDIDATIDSMRYLHIDRAGEGMNLSFKMQPRDLRQRLIAANPIDDDRWLTIKQIATGMDDGQALVVEHDGLIVASAVARPDPVAGIMRLIDLRIDFDHRREGLASALLFQLIQTTRESGLRAIAASTQANNLPANQLLAKLGFELTGLDTHYLSNHDLVKETVTLFWYLPIVT